MGIKTLDHKVFNVKQMAENAVKTRFSVTFINSSTLISPVLAGS